jgi:hypothetical protein
MASPIKIKRSAVAGKVPTTSDLQLGELGVNTNDGKLYMKKDDGSESIVELSGGGGGGGGTTINYSGASAWATFASDGSVLEALNASVAFVTTGEYAVTFTTPMPNANYAVTTGGVAPNVQITGQTANGFTCNTSQADGGATNYGGSFAVFATNALPPTGGTGTDAWAVVDTTGQPTGAGTVYTLAGSFNIAEVKKGNAIGTFEVTFVSPMPSANYAVTGNASATDGVINTYLADQTTTGFTITCRNADGLLNTNTFAFTVNATNAVLPDSFSAEQIQSVVDLAQSGATNPGASAWGSVAITTVNGPCDILANLNVASVTRTAVGKYDVVFTTPMPSSYYAVNTTPFGLGIGLSAKTLGKTTSGFTIYVLDTSSASS